MTGWGVRLAPDDRAQLPPVAQGIEAALIGWNSPEVTPELALARFLGLETAPAQRFPPESGAYVDHLVATGELLQSMDITKTTAPERFVLAVAGAFGGEAGATGGWRGIVAMSLNAMRSTNPGRSAAVERLRDAATAGRIPRAVMLENEQALTAINAWEHTYHWFDHDDERRALDGLLDGRLDRYISTAIARCGSVTDHRDTVVNALEGRS